MSITHQSESIAKIKIRVFPESLKFYYDFDNNKSFGDLKNELIEKRIIKEGTYYIEMNDDIVNDDLIVKDYVLDNNYYLNIINIDYNIIKIKINRMFDSFSTLRFYVHSSDFKVIKANENREIKVCDNNLILYFILS